MDDLISRQDAIDAFSDVLDSDFPGVSEETPRERIESIPSATCDDCIWHICNYNKVDWDGEDGEA